MRLCCTRFVFVTDSQLIGNPNRLCYLFTTRLATFIERPGGTIYFRRKCLPIDTCAAMTTTSKHRLPAAFVLYDRIQFTIGSGSNSLDLT